MFLFLISCLSFFLLSKSLSLKPLPPWASEIRLLYIWFWKGLLCFLVSWFRKSWISCSVFEIPTSMSMKKKFLKSNVKYVEETNEISLLDLPELALDCILEKLQPTELCNMAAVCRSLKDRCRSDYLWERQMKKKWGRLIGRAAYREWKWHTTLLKDSIALNKKKKKNLVRSLSCVCSISWARSKANNGSKSRSSLPVDSIMSWYLCLESGKFWIPAQVYNRENGHVGFMLSCYDAELSYDSCTDTFQARYPPHGQRTPVMEECVQWDRIRAPPMDTSPHYLHVSDCLDDLHPGDHIEIQWRRNKQFPYGWWYGVVGHLESCDRIENLCRCHNNDTVILEFNQYTPGSRWRRTTVNRKDHHEEGNETDGFYGGIRKLYNKEEISAWKHLWPKEILQ